MVYNRLERYPLVSVVLHARGPVDYLDECLLSIMNQTYPNYEVLCITSSGGANETVVRDVIRNHRARDRISVRVISHDMSTGAAIQYGIDNSSGDWITFVEPQDTIHRDYIYGLVEAATQEAYVGVVACSCVSNPGDMGVVDSFPRYEDDDGWTAIMKLATDGSYTYSTLWGKLWYKKILLAVKFPHTYYSPEQDCIYKIYTAMGFWKFVRMDDRLWVHRGLPLTITDMVYRATFGVSRIRYFDDLGYPYYSDELGLRTLYDCKKFLKSIKKIRGSDPNYVRSSVLVIYSRMNQIYNRIIHSEYLTIYQKAKIIWFCAVPKFVNFACRCTHD